MGGERAMPDLGQQPPLPRNAAVRIVQPEEEIEEQALVPAYPYYEEDPTWAIIRKHSLDATPTNVNNAYDSRHRDILSNGSQNAHDNSKQRSNSTYASSKPKGEELIPTL